MTERKSNKRPQRWKRIFVGLVLFALVLLLLPLLLPICLSIVKKIDQIKLQKGLS